MALFSYKEWFERSGVLGRNAQNTQTNQTTYFVVAALHSRAAEGAQNVKKVPKITILGQKRGKNPIQPPKTVPFLESS